MSVIAKFHVLRTLSYAAGMTSGKISQVQARKGLKSGARALKSRKALYHNRDTLKNRKDSGRRAAMSVRPKIMVVRLVPH